MPLSIADKLAIIYTGTGSQAQIAARLGVSRSTVGRILRAGSEGLDMTSYVVRYGSLVADAYREHKATARAVAKAQGLPFNPELPIYSARMESKHLLDIYDRRGRYIGRGNQTSLKAHAKANAKDGPFTARPALTNRVEIPHAHWLADRLRNEWLILVHDTGFYASVVVESVVNLYQYLVDAAARASKRQLGPTDKALLYKLALERTRDADLESRGIDPDKWEDHEDSEEDGGAPNLKLQPMLTKTTPMDRRFPGEMVVRSLNRQLQEKHEPATGAKGTTLASRILLQIDSREKDVAKTKRKAPRAIKKPR